MPRPHRRAFCGHVPQIRKTAGVWVSNRTSSRKRTAPLARSHSVWSGGSPLGDLAKTSLKCSSGHADTKLGLGVARSIGWRRLHSFKTIVHDAQSEATKHTLKKHAVHLAFQTQYLEIYGSERRTESDGNC